MYLGNLQKGRHPFHDPAIFPHLVYDKTCLITIKEPMVVDKLVVQKEYRRNPLFHQKGRNELVTLF